jgi:hypothetical protein
MYTNLNVFTEAGPNAAPIKGADMSVANNWVTIEFGNVVDVAKICVVAILPGIEILRRPCPRLAP